MSTWEKTQNNNESISQVIWKRCPKDIFVGRKVLQMGVASAVISFNDGYHKLIDVMENLGMLPGQFSLSFFEKGDYKRVTIMEHKTSEDVKKRRKRLRAVRKGFVDSVEEKEGLVYGCGEF